MPEAQEPGFTMMIFHDLPPETTSDTVLRFGEKSKSIFVRNDKNFSVLPFTNHFSALYFYQDRNSALTEGLKNTKRIFGAIYYDGRRDVEEEETQQRCDNQIFAEYYSLPDGPETEMASARNLRKKNNPPDSGPIKFGYSNAGIIPETKGDVKGAKPGMRVAGMGAGAAACS